MAPMVALTVCCFYVAFLLVIESSKHRSSSFGGWLVVMWICLVSARPVSTWFGAPPMADSVRELVEEGSPIDRWAHFLVMFLALVTVLRRAQRGVQVGRFIWSNPWLVALFVFWAASIVWSDVSFVALKRYIKEVGSVLVALVLLTERDPVGAMKSAFIRAAAIMAPLSLVLIKYFPDLGRTYHVTGELLVIGVTGHKNTLGALMLVAGVFVIWDCLASADRRPTARLAMWSLLSLVTWLLMESDSATSLLCAFVGLMLAFACRFDWFRRRAAVVLVLTAVGVSTLWLLDIWSDMSRLVIVELLDRSPNLTTRTDFWPILLSMAEENMLLGHGFASFWTGERLDYLSNSIHVMQAHNGYLETYLNGGLLALSLLLLVIFSAVRKVNAQLAAADPIAPIRLAFLGVLVLYNVSEAAFNTPGVFWFASLLMLMSSGLAESVSDQTSDLSDAGAARPATV
jgi:O-antigen ligase